PPCRRPLKDVQGEHPAQQRRPRRPLQWRTPGPGWRLRRRPRPHAGPAALNVYSMEMTDKIFRGMGEFVDFLYSLNRIPAKVAPESMFYTRLLKEVDPKLVRWESKTEVK